LLDRNLVDTFCAVGSMTIGIVTETVVPTSFLLCTNHAHAQTCTLRQVVFLGECTEQLTGHELLRYTFTTIRDRQPYSRTLLLVVRSALLVRLMHNLFQAPTAMTQLKDKALGSIINHFFCQLIKQNVRLLNDHASKRFSPAQTARAVTISLIDTSLQLFSVVLGNRVDLREVK
ncbi:hypothetical protein KCU92_g195, partial [Aureobasidium melanogenum]